jgi:RNA polymerase sigma-70 factor (ECF subfamily)
VREDFHRLVQANQAMVFSLACHFLHDRAAAEELAQEVFLSLYRNLERIASPEHAVFWLRKVTMQRAIDEGRRRRRRPVVSLEEVPEPGAPMPPEDALLGDLLRRLIASLPEAPRAVMVLRYQEEIDTSEIAVILGMPLATVKSHLQRSLALLREKLERRGVTEPRG